jgi:hypothetical protein
MIPKQKNPVGPYASECPTCGSPPGYGCVDADAGQRRLIHSDRTSLRPRDRNAQRSRRRAADGGTVATSGVSARESGKFERERP